MNFEKPQKGNPHQLTVNQHCFPASCIKRFAGTDGKIQLVLLPQEEIVTVGPAAEMFCVKRAWDQRAEHIFMKEIEDKYHALANVIISNNKLALDTNQQQIITDMFALWNIRYHWKGQPIKDQNIERAIRAAVEYTNDQQEELEKHGITAIRPDLKIPGRSLTGLSIQQNLFSVRKQMHDAHWGILSSRTGAFLVPDHSPNSRMMPLTPNLCLFAQSDNDEVTESELAEINARSISDSTDYYFAKDISKCPR